MSALSICIVCDDTSCEWTVICAAPGDAPWFATFGTN